MKNTIIILTLFLLTKPVFGQGDASVIEGEWYQCKINGQYLEYIFDQGEFSQQHEFGSWTGTYQIKSDTIYYKEQRSYHWDYKMYIQESRNDSLAVKELDFLYPDENSEFLLNRIKPELMNNTSFLERKKIHNCIDRRSDDQKHRDSLRNIESTKRINKLIQDLDSLRGLDKKN